MEKLVTSINAILFDLDGTLIDSTDQIYQAVALTRKNKSYPDLSLAHIQSKIGLQAKELFSDLTLSAPEEESAVRLFRQYLLSIELNQSNLFDGVFDLLIWARENKIRLAVATNKPRNLALKVLEDTGIAEFFEHVEGSDDLPFKPHPAIITRCLDVLKVERHLVCMIGDRVEDTLAAKKSGVKAFGVIQGPHTSESHIEAGAEKTFQNFNSLLDFFKLGGLR